jgi:hypothetical protein
MKKPQNFSSSCPRLVAAKTMTNRCFMTHLECRNVRFCYSIWPAGGSALVPLRSAIKPTLFQPVIIASFEPAKRNICFSFDNGGRLIRSARRLSTACIETLTPLNRHRSAVDPGPSSIVEPADPSDDLTSAFIRLSNLPTYPLDRLSRYEATLWRQACQILFTLQCLDAQTL